MVNAGASPVTAQSQPRYAWVVMSLLWAMDIAATIIFFSIGVLVPVLKEDLGLSTLQIGLLGSAGFLGFGMMALPASILLTRFNPRRTILVISIAMVAVGMAQALAPNAEALLAGRFVFVLLAVSRVQLQVVFVRSWFLPRYFAPVISAEFSIRSVGQLISLAAVPPLLVLLDGWRGFYVIIALTLLILSLLWFALGKEGKPAPSAVAISPSRGSPLGVLRREKALWALAVCQAGAALAFASFVTFYPAYAQERLGVSLTSIGLVMGLFPVGSIIGSLVFGPLSQLTGRRKPFIWVSGLVLPGVYLLLVWTDSLPVAALLLLAAGMFANGVAPIIFTIPLDLKLSTREVVVAQGWIRTVFPIGATIGPVLVAAIERSTGSLALGLAIVSPMALSLFLGGLLLPETGPRGPKRS